MEINLKKLIASVVLCLMVGFVGSLITTPSISNWYQTLNKPFFNPPNWIFAPVWTVLYILMGVSLYMIWNKKIKEPVKNAAFKIFFIQLILNFAWSIIFFGFHSPLLAFIEIIALWILIFLTIKTFSKISKDAGYLLYPYLAWVSFASVLNLFIAILNS